jgi:peptide/nickel transport system permease protein
MASREALSRSVPTIATASSRAVRRGRLRKHLRRHGIVLAGLIVLVAYLLIALLAPVVAPRAPTAIAPRQALRGPSAAARFGTDRYGRDVFSRVIYGTRNSLIVAFTAIGISAAVGGLLGLIGGYWSGLIDLVIGRLMDILFSFPALLLAIAIAAVLTPGLRNVVIAIAVVYVPLFSRVVRGPVIAEAQREYVVAARVAGARGGRILCRHVAPNVVSPWIVQVSIGLSHALLLEAALGYLGLGIQPPTPSWGAMLNEGRDYIDAAPWLSIFPGIAIMLAVLAFNLVGDGLRDLIDPTTR